MGQGIDLHIALDLIHAINTSQRVNAIDIHRARATNTFPARAAKGQGGINFVFDFDQRVQDHRAASVHIHKISINAGVFSIIWRPPIDGKLADIGCTCWFWPGFSSADP